MTTKSECKGCIKIENKRTYKGEGIYIGRPSVLENPFRLRIDGNREEVIELFRDYAIAKSKNEDNFYFALFVIADAIRMGKTIHLVCWCAPLPCHGDVIREMVEEINDSD